MSYTLRLAIVLPLLSFALPAVAQDPRQPGGATNAASAVSVDAAQMNDSASASSSMDTMATVAASSPADNATTPSPPCTRTVRDHCIKAGKVQPAPR